jgi:hypothetical protein
MARGPLAGASGPGKFSARTDSAVGSPELKMGSIAYGEGVETQAIKSGAPLATTPDVRPSQAPSVPTPQTPVTPLYAPSSRLDEPVTSGVDIGEGPGSAALAMRNKTTVRKISDILAEMIPFDDTGEVAILYQQALARGN